MPFAVGLVPERRMAALSLSILTDSGDRVDWESTFETQRAGSVHVSRSPAPAPVGKYLPIRSAGADTAR